MTLDGLSELISRLTFFSSADEENLDQHLVGF